jgi:hypothetical protein
MSKFSLMVMGGAVGLLCAGSPAVMAQSTAPGGSQTNVSEAKPPFKIPNDGKFKYRGKSPQGEVRLMEVDWQASGLNENTGTTRISGDAKYKNPKTGMMDTLAIDANRSYITKTGELFFALHAFGDKVYGPVDLAALESARLATSQKPAENQKDEPRASGIGGALLNPKNSEYSTDSNAPSTNVSKNKLLENAEGSDTIEKTSGATAGQSCSFKNAKAYDDRFIASDSLRNGNDTFYWQQSDYTFGNNRKILVKIGRTCSLLNGTDQIKSVLDDDGVARIYYGGKLIKSTKKFYSNKFKTLTKAYNLIVAEDKYVRKFGLQKLPGAVRNKKKKVVVTEGALILGAAVKLIGKENIAHMRTPLGVRAFNSIQGLLKLEKSDWVVHRIVTHAGLKVDHHPTRGRSLVQGETSAAGEARGQYTTIDDIVANTPTPVRQEDLVNEILQGRRTLNPTLDHVNLGQTLVESGFYTLQGRTDYTRDLTTYFRNQRALFPNGLNNDTAANFQRSMEKLLNECREVRRLTRIEPFAIEHYNGISNNFTRLLEALNRSGRLAIQADDFRNMLARIPGFQPGRDQLRNIMRSEIQTILDNWRITDQLPNQDDLPVEIARAVTLLVVMLSPLGL